MFHVNVFRVAADMSISIDAKYSAEVVRGLEEKKVVALNSIKILDFDILLSALDMMQ